MTLPRMKIALWRPAALLLVWSLSLACSLLPGYTAPKGFTAPNQPTDAAPRISGQATETVEPASPPEATSPPTIDPATAGPYSLAISDRYPFFQTKVTIGLSLTAREGEIWFGTVSGTLEKFDSQNETFGQTISLAPDRGGGMPMVFPVQKMAFEDKYLWVFAGFFEGSDTPPGLYALDPESGNVVQQWDLNAPEWMEDYERGFSSEEFGVSPGMIWIDSHIVDTRTFEVQKAYMPGMTLFAYDGREWMWMNGEMGGSCDDMILVNVNDPTSEWCEDAWPFFTHTADGASPMGLGSPMLFAGDRLWMAGGWSAESLSDGPEYVLEAYPADIDEAMKTSGPLVSVPLPDDAANVMMIFAGDYLWLVCTGDKVGWLYQLDSKTGETLNSLDLVGDEGRAVGDVPQDVATEGDNLWVLTSRQLLRIKLP